MGASPLSVSHYTNSVGACRTSAPTKGIRSPGVGPGIPVFSSGVIIAGRWSSPRGFWGTSLSFLGGSPRLCFTKENSERRLASTPGSLTQYSPSLVKFSSDNNLPAYPTRCIIVLGRNSFDTGLWKKKQIFLLESVLCWSYFIPYSNVSPSLGQWPLA